MASIPEFDLAYGAFLVVVQSKNPGPGYRMCMVRALVKPLDDRHEHLEAADSHCSVCGGRRVAWYDRAFCCDERCELATPMTRFISDVS